jgi:hypothetical protein
MIVAALRVRGRFTVAWNVGLPEYRRNKQSVSVAAACPIMRVRPRHH